LGVAIGPNFESCGETLAAICDICDFPRSTSFDPAGNFARRETKSNLHGNCNWDKLRIVASGLKCSLWRLSLEAVP